jgi:polyisoprenoid-binding protein YceI
MNTHQDVSDFAPRDGSQSATAGEHERWDINPAGSRLTFVLRHLIVHQIPGRFHSWGGTLFLGRAAPWLSSVNVWIDLGSVDTDSVERDAHIRSAEFLDVERFPRAEFTSTAIEAQGAGLLVRGRLQLHGITADLDLEVQWATGAGTTVENAYSIRGKLDRQLFGLHWNQDLDVGGLVLGDQIDLAAHVELVRPEAVARTAASASRGTSP